jgi:hypothetical protein
MRDILILLTGTDHPSKYSLNNNNNMDNKSKITLLYLVINPWGWGLGPSIKTAKANARAASGMNRGPWALYIYQVNVPGPVTQELIHKVVNSLEISSECLTYHNEFITLLDKQSI